MYYLVFFSENIDYGRLVGGGLSKFVDVLNRMREHLLSIVLVCQHPPPTKFYRHPHWMRVDLPQLSYGLVEVRASVMGL